MNENEKMFPDLSPELRAQALADNAFKQDKQTVKRIYTPDEIAQKRGALAEGIMDEGAVNDEIATVTAPLKNKLKEIKTLRKELVKQVRRGAYESVEDVFMFDNQEEGMMYEYDIEGNLLNTRKLQPAERQARIKQINKVA